MCTWAICWMTVQLGGAGEGIGLIFVFAMLADIGIACAVSAGLGSLFKK